LPLEKLARVEDIPEGRTKFVCVRGEPVLVANWQGRFYALHGICPHKGNPLAGAILWDNLIDCPYHHFQYDVVTGENFYPKNVYPKDYAKLQEQLRPIRTYRVEVRDGEILGDVE
jgi:3-phenylpropionate/trans-cinnamate dioxygenase ferredoxin subunit